MARRDKMRRESRDTGFWERNDAMLAGEMHPVTQALWVALMAVIGVATMAMLWLASR